jgi:hypothetical protein
MKNKRKTERKKRPEIVVERVPDRRYTISDFAELIAHPHSSTILNVQRKIGGKQTN